MRDRYEYEMRMMDKPMSPLGRMRHYHDMLATSADATEIDEVATLELPIVDRAELPTQELLQCHHADADRVATLELPIVDRAELPTQELLAQIDVRAISEASRLSLLVFNGSLITEQPTWMLPVIPRKVGNQVSLSASQTRSSESYLSLAFGIIKNSGIYAVGAFASPLISLILTPFLTHHLSSSDYGGLAVLYTIIDLVTAITQLGLSPAFFRAYNGDYESPRDRLGVLSATIILLSLVSIPIAIVMMVAAPSLSELLFNSPSFSGSVRLTALVIILENLTVPGISWLRAEKRAIFYSALSIANMLLILGTNIVLVGLLHMGVNGALLAKGVGYSAIVVCTFPMLLLLLIRRHNLHLRFDIVRNMLFFGVPTIFSSLAAWILQLSDRFLLSHFGLLAQAASYSVSDSLGGALTPLFFAPFGLAWIPVMYVIAKREDAARIFQVVSRWVTNVALFGTFAVILLSTAVLEVFFPPSYHSAALLIPIIALSEMSLSCYYLLTMGILIRKKTLCEFIYMLIGASVNLLLNIFLIPHFGAMGAAVSTLLAYVIIVLVAYTVNQKIYPINFEIGLFMIKLFVGVALYSGSSVLADTQKPLIGWSISIGTLLLYGIFLMLLGGLTPKRLKKTFGYVQEALSKRRKETYA